MKAVQRLVTASLLLFLGACAGMGKPPPTTSSWQAQRAHIDTITHFTASGKIALRSPEQAESASLLWQQMGSATHMRLSGPMGLSATTVDSDGSEVVIRQGDDSSRWKLDDAALPDRPGWNLPLRSLHHWLKGVPAPDLEVEALQLNSTGQLPDSLQQAGWLVSYEEFAEFEGFTLPTRLRVSREDTSARIILRRWQDIATP